MKSKKMTAQQKTYALSNMKNDMDALAAEITQALADNEPMADYTEQLNELAFIVETLQQIAEHGADEDES